MKRSTKWIIVILIISLVIGISEFNIRKTKNESINIDKEFLKSNWAGAGDGYDIDEVLFVQKFTDNESLAIALVKNSYGTPYVYEIYDGRGRYDNVYYVEISNLENLTSQFNIYQLENTKYGQPYFCIFNNPVQETVIINEKTHDVFKFECNIEGKNYSLGFYCGLNIE